MATLEYTVVVQDGEKNRLRERLSNDQTLNTRIKKVTSGEGLYRINVDVISFQRKKDVEELIRGHKNDIVRSLRISGAAPDVDEKRSVKVAKASVRFAVSYVIIFANIIASAVAADYTKLTTGMFPWYVVFLVSIPSAFGSVYTIDKTKPT